MKNWNKWTNPCGTISWGKCSNDVTANATTWPKSTLQHRRGTINISLPKTNDNNMTTTKWDLHSGVPLVPAWYMHPLTYPSLWGVSKSPFLVSRQLSGLVGRWKGESEFFHSNTKPCKFFGTLSIHLAFRSLSPSTQFPCEKGSEEEEPRSSRRLDCGNGQTSNGRTMLEENLSFCVEREMHHHGNPHSGLQNGIPFVKKPTPHPLANSRWKGESGFFHSNTKPCKVFGTLSIHLAFRSLSPSTQFPCEKGSEKEEPRSSHRLERVFYGGVGCTVGQICPKIPHFCA